MAATAAAKQMEAIRPGQYLHHRTPRREPTTTIARARQSQAELG